MQISADERSDWNDFVAASGHGDVLQCWEWGELKSRTGWRPLHLGVKDRERLTAVALVLSRPIPHTGRCLFYCPRGPIADPAAPDAFESIIAQIRDHARQHRAIALKIDPAIPRDADEFVARLTSAGFCSARSVGPGFGATQPHAVMKVDIAPAEDDLLATFHSKWRYNIRLAARKAVTVSAECTRDDMDVFYDLLEVTAERDGFRVRSRSYFHDIWDVVIERDLGRLSMAYADDAPIAGAVAFVLGHQCWYVYGASDYEYRKLMPNHLVQWEMMRWAKSRGCTMYDMRGVSPEVDGEPTDEHLAGLNRFKRGFGAQYVEYVGDWDLVFSPCWYAAFQRLLPMARRLLAPGASDPGD